MQQRYKLNNCAIIRRILAFVLLLIFMFSSTPKKYLHDLIADHSDYYGFVHSDSDATISKAGFNCHCDDLVVATPFMKATFATGLSATTLFAEFVAAAYSRASITTLYTKDLRGPPGVA